jgi:hypothetical protein
MTEEDGLAVQGALDTWQESCVERILAEGEFVPDGLTPDEWKQVIPPDGCPNASNRSPDVERWARRRVSVDLPPCSFTVEIVDWDVGIPLHFVREDGRWVRVLLDQRR